MSYKCTENINLLKNSSILNAPKTVLVTCFKSCWLVKSLVDPSTLGRLKKILAPQPWEN